MEMCTIFQRQYWYRQHFSWIYAYSILKYLLRCGRFQGDWPEVFQVCLEGDPKFSSKFKGWSEIFLHKLKADKKQTHKLTKLYPGFSEKLYKIIVPSAVTCELWIHAENEFTCDLLTLIAIWKVQLCKCYNFSAGFLRNDNFAF